MTEFTKSKPDGRQPIDKASLDCDKLDLKNKEGTVLNLWHV
jgi:hypothetical protein